MASVSLYYYKARMYDPALGRFLQTDPVGYRAGTNLYEYAANDPVNNRDFLGLCPEGISECVIVTAPHLPPFSWDIPAALRDALDALRNFKLPTFIPAAEAAARGTNGHRYVYNMPTMCPAPKAFGLWKQAGVSAPGAPAAREGFTTPITLWLNNGRNQISQAVNSSAMTITNTALPTHEFQGKVDIRVTPAPYGSDISIVGTGPDKGALVNWLNDAVGIAWFGTMANSIATMCGAPSVESSVN